MGKARDDRVQEPLLESTVQKRVLQMAKKKQRSPFWVVSTHVLTTGFAMPLLAGLLAYVLILLLELPQIGAFLLMLLLQAIGYAGGVYYSLSYIRKVALVANPPGCTKPSIITFSVLAGLAFLFNAGSLLREPAGLNALAGICCLAVFYTVVCIAFAKITRRGFERMPASAATS